MAVKGCQVHLNAHNTAIEMEFEEYQLFFQFQGSFYLAILGALNTFVLLMQPDSEAPKSVKIRPVGASA